MHSYCRAASTVAVLLAIGTSACGGGGNSSPTDPGDDPPQETNTISLRAGQLQDNETNTGRSGVIKVYRYLSPDTILLAEIETGSDGTYPQTEVLTKDEDDIAKFLIQAMIREGGAQNSYVRTTHFYSSSGPPVGPNVIRAVTWNGGKPELGLQANGITPEQFRDYLCDEENKVLHPLNRGVLLDTVSSKDACQLVPPKDLDKVYIIERTIVGGEDLGGFTEAEIQTIIDKLHHPDDILRYRAEKAYQTVRSGPIGEGPITIEEDGNIVADRGNIVVYRDTTHQSSSVVPQRNENGRRVAGRVRVAGFSGFSDSEQRFRAVLSHQFGHIEGANAHQIAIERERSIFHPRYVRETPSLIDEKAGYIFHEETFPGRPAEKILRMEFFAQE